MLPYDFLLAETDPKLVAMELDLCWISVAGKDPRTYFDKYPGRFQLVHVKDWVKDASSPNAYQGAMGQSVKFGGRMADVGQGFHRLEEALRALRQRRHQTLLRGKRRSQIKRSTT